MGASTFADLETAADVFAKALDKPHKYGCLLCPLPADMAKEITDWCLEHIPDYHLGPGGRELRPHLTLQTFFLVWAIAVAAVAVVAIRAKGTIAWREAKLSESSPKVAGVFFPLNPTAPIDVIQDQKLQEGFSTTDATGNPIAVVGKDLHSQFVPSPFIPGLSKICVARFADRSQSKDRPLPYLKMTAVVRECFPAFRTLSRGRLFLLSQGRPPADAATESPCVNAVSFLSTKIPDSLGETSTAPLTSTDLPSCCFYHSPSFSYET